MRTIICPHCDMTSEIPTMRAEQVAQCSRCHQVICKQTYYTSSSMLALSICALLLLFPAFTLPLFSIHILGLTEDTNLLHGALMMLNSAPLVAFMVLFCAVVAPTLLIISIVISSTCFTFNLRFVFLPQILKVTRILSHWSMLEVYLVSLIVAIFKLIAYADLYFGLGFYFFIALLWINMLILSNYSDHHSWEKYYNE